MVEKLNQAEMCSLKGGVTKEEYCNTVRQLMRDNASSWTDAQLDAAADALSKNC